MSVVGKLRFVLSAVPSAGVKRQRLRAVVALLVFLGLILVVAPGAREAAAATAVPVIFDTSMYASPDGAGAEAMLFGGQLQGLDQVIALGVNTPYTIPNVSTVSWRCEAAIAQFYGFSSVPIGTDMPNNAPPPPTNDFISPCAKFASPQTPAPLSAVAVFRQALVNQADGSVVIIETGFEENIANLLISPADAISPLTGSQLIVAKVKELVVMGGGYPSRAGETNFNGHAGDAEIVASQWPTKIVYDGYEVGAQVLAGQGVTSIQPIVSPDRALMKAYGGNNKAIVAYNLTAAYHAILPNDLALTEVGPGTNSIMNTGANTFTSGAGNQYYLSLTNTAGLESSINSLWDTMPSTYPQMITFTSTAPTTGSVKQTYAPTATSDAALPVNIALDQASTGCSLSGGIVTFTAFGTCVIDANQAGTGHYQSAPQVQQSIPVTSKATSVIEITSTAPSPARAGGAYTPTGRSSSGDAVAVSLGSTSTGCQLIPGGILFRSVGTCAIDFTDPGNKNYNSSMITQSIVIHRGHVHLTAAAAPGLVRTGARVSFSGTLSPYIAGGAVIFKVDGKGICSSAVRNGIASCRVSIHLSRGSHAVMATYAGTGSFYGARATTLLRVS